MLIRYDCRDRINKTVFVCEGTDCADAITINPASPPTGVNRTARSESDCVKWVLVSNDCQKLSNEGKAVLVCGEHDNLSELTGKVAMNLTSGCKNATMEFGHGVEQSAYHVDTNGCHAVAQEPDSQGLDYAHLVEKDLAQDQTSVGRP